MLGQRRHVAVVVQDYGDAEALRHEIPDRNVDNRQVHGSFAKFVPSVSGAAVAGQKSPTI
jgi:hypothetical protein